MTGPFSFSFAGDDIEDHGHSETPAAMAAPVEAAPAASAFPVQGKPLLPPAAHHLDDMLARLPSKIAYNTLSVDLDDGSTIHLPRRELWDVRVQLMAEDDDTSDAATGLGEHDVKTGIYEGGFKSWESSVDLVKVLAAQKVNNVLNRGSCAAIELGCGTALPSLAIFRWALEEQKEPGNTSSMVLALADYNPAVLHLVTLPNFILAWALEQRGKASVLDEAFSSEGELELSAEVLQAFEEALLSNRISLCFLSGAWSPELVEMIYDLPGLSMAAETLVMGAETIYSPFALDSFTATLLSILGRRRQQQSGDGAVAIVAAKRLYFGVGGSLDDFIDKIKTLGASVETLREEADGVRRGVVRCRLL